jgi:hypothetical protein
MFGFRFYFSIGTVAVLFGAAHVAFGAEDYSQWAYSKNITLNTTPSGADVATNQLGFPVLVRLTGAAFNFLQAQDSGQDIRFAKANGDHLAYQIERWDRSNQLAEIWVRVDTVYGNNGSQYFTMYWGNEPAVGQSDGTAVFDTAGGFVGIWHLGEGSGNVYDATVNARTGTNNGTTSGGGDIGLARNFTRASSNSITAADANCFDITGSLTLSAWIQCSSVDSACIVGKDSAAYDLEIIPASYMRLGLNGAMYLSTAASSFSPGAWYHVAATYNTSGSAASFYVNGVQLGGSVAGASPVATATSVYIGARASGKYFNGIIDEPRIEKTARSPDWLKLCYQNQRFDQNLVCLDDYSKWAFSANIGINTGASGANTSTQVARFPYLVRLTSANFSFSQAQANGEDIRFSRWDGTHFPFEIERWDTTNKVAEIWVRIDTVYPNNATQYFKMYWGMSGVTSASDSASTFELSNGFGGVWHLKEAGNTTPGGYGNATGAAAYTDTGVAMTSATLVAGAVGLGQSFNGTSQFIRLSPQVVGGAKGTISCWVQWSGAYPASSRAYAFGTNQTNSSQGNLNSRHYMSINNTTGYPFTQFAPSSNYTANFAIGTNFHHFTVAWDTSGSTDSIDTYWDGNRVNHTTPGNLIALTPNVARIACYGGNGDGTSSGGQYWSGIIDEMRVDQTVRSADWIKLCYYNQSPGSAILMADSVEAFRPLAIKRYTTGATIDSIYVGTAAQGRWSVKFAGNKGGGIKYLARDSLSGTANQVATNLFSVLYNNVASDGGTGILSLLDSSTVFARIRQQTTVSSQPFTIDYTVLGSGKMGVRVTTYASSNLNAPLEFRIAHNAAGSSSVDTVRYGSSPSNCRGLLHADSGAGMYDILLVPLGAWSQADAGTSSNQYVGIKSGAWSLAAGRRQTWEFSIDFSHRSLHDSAAGLACVNNYANPDTMRYFTGTPLLEKAWESQLVGHWKFDERTGDTAGDNSGSGNLGWIRVTPRWTNGIWGGADSLAGTDSIVVAPSAGFLGNNSKGFTILGWMKPAVQLATTSVIFKKYSDATVNGYKLTGSAGGQLLFTISNGGATVTLAGKTVLAAGQWYHVGAQLAATGDTMKLYVNGVIDSMRVGGALGMPGSTNLTTDSVMMGNRYNGVLDDMRLYGSQLADEQVRAVYLKGFSPNLCMYSARADNNSTVQAGLNGFTYNRFLPAMQVANYWAGGDVPSYVYVDGVLLSSASGDYVAGANAAQHTVYVGFNRTINANSIIYISGTAASTVTPTNAMPRMYWGSIASAPQHFYVKNFSGDYFSSSTANQFFIDWKMDSSSNGKDGEIYCLKTSARSPNAKADTSGSAASGNLVPPPGDSATWGYQNVKVGGAWISSARHIRSLPSYTVVESSAVRVTLQLNDRKIANLTDSCFLRTRWTVYPTGQIFRWDSIYGVKNGANAANIDSARADFFQKYASDGTVYSLDTCERGGVRGSNTIQDFAAAFLSFKQGTSWVVHPYHGPGTDTTVWVSNNAAGNHYAGTRFQGGLAGGNLWSNGNLPFQMAYYQDISRSVILTNTGIDSVARGVQNFEHPIASSPNAHPLTMTTGALLFGAAATPGDLDTNGFNEREGAYVIDAVGTSNTVQFTLNAASASRTVDTCRYYPAFRIKNYYAATAPQYVFVNGVLKTAGYDYDAYLDKANWAAVVQFNQVFCGNAVIYISYDRTLAVTMSDFGASAGDRNDTLRWKTQSEEQNLGFYIYKRIKPTFLDSLIRRRDGEESSDSTRDDNAMTCLKKGLITNSDTAWRPVNTQIIGGARQGVSTGPRNYSVVDYNVFNDVVYEYKLESVDYNNAREPFGKYAEARPGHILPRVFDLRPNYPNPFRTLTMIRFAVPVKTRVTLSVYNLQGRLVRRLVDAARLEPGSYKSVWDGRDDHGRSVASGPYVYRLQSPLFIGSHLMILSR